MLKKWATRYMVSRTWAQSTPRCEQYCRCWRRKCRATMWIGQRWTMAARTIFFSFIVLTKNTIWVFMFLLMFYLSPAVLLAGSLLHLFPHSSSPSRGKGGGYVILTALPTTCEWFVVTQSSIVVPVYHTNLLCRRESKLDYIYHYHFKL